MSYCEITKQWLPASKMKKAKDRCGDLKLVSVDVETFYCEWCQCEYIAGEVPSYEVNNTSGDEILICKDCRTADFYCCDDCGSIHPADMMYDTGENHIICHVCRENYRTCTDCGDLIHYENVQWDENDNPYCEACASEYHYCERCGRLFTGDDAGGWYEDDDYWYCYDCLPSARFINSYGYKPIPNFHKTYNEKRTKEYFGFEIEVEGCISYAKQFLETFDDTKEEDLYLKRDGSVDGFEIVTHPMTRKWFYKKFMPKMEKGLAFLKEKGFRGHNRAGIHIHVSDGAVSLDQYKKLLLLLYPDNEKVYKKWLAITQRHDDKMRQWSSMKLSSPEYNRKRKKDGFEEIESRKRSSIQGKPDIARTRYTAMNMENSATIEFRIFNSNIRPERIIKNAQVIFSLLDFTNTDKLPTYHNYIRFVEEHKENYIELWDFLLEKKIVQSREEREQYKKIIKAMRTVDKNVITYDEALDLLQANNPNKLRGIDDNDENERSQECVLPY